MAARGFTPVPNLLLDHQAALGLSPREVIAIVQIEALRKRDGGAVVASREMFARRLGMTAKGIDKVLKPLRDRGLLETTPTSRARGGRGENIWSVHGLRALLALIAENERAGRGPRHGLGEASARLAGSS